MIGKVLSDFRNLWISEKSVPVALDVMILPGREP